MNHPTLNPKGKTCHEVDELRTEAKKLIAAYTAAGTTKADKKHRENFLAILEISTIFVIVDKAERLSMDMQIEVERLRSNCHLAMLSDYAADNFKKMVDKSLAKSLRLNTEKEICHAILHIYSASLDFGEEITTT